MSRFTRSIKKNSTGIILMTFAAFFTSLGQMFWKLSDAGINLNLIGGFGFYFLGAVLMIVSFRFGSLSVLHPLLSLGYVFALFLGVFLVGETIGITHFSGILLIILGVVLIGGGDD
ncbi:EamA family transporter [Pontibacillus yanchengensis]|uniref:Membrane protein n=1 Tax=Pontibacillus yanchengensis Y32 TaxID=1385514 RepID=A0A0A2T7W0_9BACI|nr:EamA family transporter [Pontibacillus yanchengensis]KGP71847.1 membrane protein [Pontibacillus yanchengensis Y32]